MRPEQLTALDWGATAQDRDFGRALYRGVRVDKLEALLSRSDVAELARILGEQREKRRF